MAFIFQNNLLLLQTRRVFIKRNFWAWLNIMFNRVSEDRIKAVGPDRACAEWLVRNGAQITFEGEGPTDDYNLLVVPPEGVFKRLVGIEATDASITHHGFRHLKGCKYVKSIKFRKCPYVSDEAVEQLSYVKESLKALHISSCDEVTDKGVISVTQLRNLNTLTLYDLRVKDWKKCETELQSSLPSCKLNLTSPKA